MQDRITAPAGGLSAEMLFSIVNQTSEIIFARDLEGRYLMMNPAGAAQSGRKPEDFVGRTTAEISPPEVARRVAETDRQVIETGQPYTYEVSSPGPLGVRDYVVTKSLLFDAQGKPCGIFGLSRDITESKRARNATFLIEAARLLVSSLDSEEILEKLVRIALPHFATWCCIDLLESDGLVHRKHFAHSDPELEARLLEHQRKFPIAPNSFSTIVETVSSGKTFANNRIEGEFLSDMVRKRIDGNEFAKEFGAGSLICVPLRGRQRIMGAVSFISREFGRYGPADIALAETLIGAASLAVENAGLYADSLRAIALRDEFLSIAAHELRTPLTVLRGHSYYFLQLLRSNDLKRLPKDEMVKLFEISDRETERFARLINNLLDVSSILGGRMQLRLEHVDLVSVVADATGRLEPRLREAGCRLEVSGPPALEGVWDRVRLDQVVTNLVANAAKYAPGKPIHLRLEATATRVRLVVRDEGDGIATADHARIFNRFERGPTRPGTEGLGLGLYIVRQIVEAHRGSVSIESEPGRGASFTVELPARTGPSQ